MKFTIEELITFCEAEELNHRVREKRADDASGYTRSNNKNIRTVVAIQEEIYGDIYKQITDTMRKYQQIKEQVDIAIDKENFAISDARLIQIREIIDGNETV